MNHLLHLGINAHHSCIEIWMVSYQDLRIPSRSNKYRIYAATDWCHEDLTNLQPDEEREGYDYGCVLATGIVFWLGEFEIEERK